MVCSELAREHVSCRLCGSDQARVRFVIDIQTRQLSGVWLRDVFCPVSGPETVVQCQVCGLFYVNPRLKAVDGLQTFSAAQERAYFQQTYPQRLIVYRQLVSQMPDRVGRQVQRLLDIGCGDGVLLEAACQAGINAEGIEVSPSLVSLVQARLGTAAIVPGSVATLPEAQYDVVTLLNVIEHLREPVALVTAITRILRPGGMLFVHTPNLEGLPARLHGANWHHIEPLEHLVYFTPRTLKQLLQKAGLEPVGRFALASISGAGSLMHHLLARAGLSPGNGLGMVARRPPI